MVVALSWNSCLERGMGTFDGDWNGWNSHRVQWSWSSYMVKLLVVLNGGYERLFIALLQLLFLVSCSSCFVFGFTGWTLESWRIKIVLWRRQMCISRKTKLESKLQVNLAIFYRNVQVCLARLAVPNLHDFINTAEKEGFFSTE